MFTTPPPPPPSAGQQNPASTPGFSPPSSSSFHDTFQFPSHVGPRTWLIAAGTSAVGLRLARQVLAHGDNVVLGVPPPVYDDLHGVVAGPLDQPLPRYESDQFRLFLHALDDFLPDPDDVEAQQYGGDIAADASDGSLVSDEDPDSPISPAHVERERLEGSSILYSERKPSMGQRGDPAASATGTTAATGTSGRSRRPLRPVRLDPRSYAQCQAAAATAKAAFGGVDILVCNCARVVIGAVEELGTSEETLALMREQLETNFYSNVNAIKACLPDMRDGKKGAHIVVITGVTGHLGTPGLGAFCAAGWALEGYCDSIAYEIAPFNIKLSIVQPLLETAVLANEIKTPPSLPQYQPPSHPAPLSRNVIGGLLDRIHGIDPSTATAATSQQERRGSAATDHTSESDDMRSVSKTLGSSTTVSIHEPRLPAELLDGLIHETLFSVCAIAGHPNPPQRHIVGTEGVISVREKLKTVSVELEDLVSASTAADLIVEEPQNQQQFQIT